MKSGREKIFLLTALFTAFFCSLAAAQLTIAMEPVSDSNLFYPLEVREYRLVAANLSEESSSPINVRVSVPRSLSLVVDGEERNERFIYIPALRPGFVEERFFLVKGISESRSAEISAEYELDGISFGSSTSAEVMSSGVSLAARIENSSPSPGEKGSVLFTLSNRSEEDISRIRVELLSPESIVVEFPPLELAVLEAGQSADEEFMFSAGELKGDNTVILRVLFIDSMGPHVLEKPFGVQVQTRDYYVLGMVAFILILVAVFFFSKKKPN